MNEILSYVVIVIFVGVMAFMVPILLNVIDKQKLGKIIEWAKIFVECAEKIYASGEGTKKKDFVWEHLADVINLKETNINEIDAIIESCVLNLKK